MLFYLSLLTGIAGKFHRSVNIQADDKIIKFVNFLREDSGIDTLDTHPALLKVAKEQVRYMCENNIEEIKDIKSFTGLGFSYCHKLSNERNIVFVNES